jgi:acetate kinase
MISTTPSVLADNGGSFSIKFALFEADGAPRRIPEGPIEGIGEHTAQVRARVREGRGLLGFKLDQKRNLANEGVISADSSRFVVRRPRENG